MILFILFQVIFGVMIIDLYVDLIGVLCFCCQYLHVIFYWFFHYFVLISFVFIHFVTKLKVFRVFAISFCLNLKVIFLLTKWYKQFQKLWIQRRYFPTQQKPLQSILPKNLSTRNYTTNYWARLHYTKTFQSHTQHNSDE